MYLPVVKIVRGFLSVLQSDQLGYFWYCSELTYLYIFDEFASVLVVMLVDARCVLPLASGSLFNLSAEFFGHELTSI